MNAPVYAHIPETHLKPLRPEDLRRRAPLVGASGHRYGDMTLNPHFHDLVAGGPVMLFRRMPKAANFYHDPDCEWYKIMGQALIKHSVRVKFDPYILFALFMNFILAKLFMLKQNQQNILAYVVTAFFLTVTYMFGLNQADIQTQQQVTIGQMQMQAERAAATLQIKETVIDQQDKQLRLAGQNIDELSKKMAQLEADVKQAQATQLRMMQDMTAALLSGEPDARLKKKMRSYIRSPQS
jgi:hypothetical protein